MEEVKKQNTELTKYPEDSNTYSGTSGNQSNWSKRNGYNPGPDYDFSRFKKSKWEWFGKFIGIGIFAFVCNYLFKACFILVLCLVCMPMNAQYRYHKPNIRTYNLRLPPIRLPKEGNSKSKVVSVALPTVYIPKVQSPLDKIKLPPIPIHKDYVLPQPKPEDVNKGEQLLDSALHCFSAHDTVNLINYIKRSASVQYPMAIYYYGLSIIEGYGVKQNTNFGLFYINEASKLDCADATYFIARLYELGYYGYKKDSIMALQYYEKSAEQGSFEGKVTSGDIYYDGGDTLKAIKYWKSAYEHGKKYLLIKEQEKKLARVAYNLGCLSSSNPEKDVETKNYFKTSAELGYVDGQVWYGDYCMQGYGMERDSAQAVYWYKQAALQNHVGAMQVLPFYYYDAHENDSTILWGTKPECRDSADIQYIVGAAYYVKEDYENAEVWWKKAASQNQMDAILWLYIHYDEDEKDSLMAFQYLRQAVDLEQPDALCDMGYYYLNGFIVSKDISKAIDYYERSAKLGCTVSYNYLGSIYFWNKYGVKNRQLAVSYWKQGAEAGNPECQYNYGCVLKKGRGVKKDKQQAIHWFTLSAQNGNEDAQEELKKMGITYETMK